MAGRNCQNLSEARPAERRNRQCAKRIALTLGVGKCARQGVAKPVSALARAAGAGIPLEDSRTRDRSPPGQRPEGALGKALRARSAEPMARNDFFLHIDQATGISHFALLRFE